MVLTQGLVTASLLAIVLPAYADPTDVTLQLNGVVTSAVGGTDNTFTVGQPVSGLVQFDFTKGTELIEPTGFPNGSRFTGIGNYSLSMGPDHLTTSDPAGLAFILTDGGPGLADQLTLFDMVPFATNNPSLLVFDDLVITLNDPDGTGFTAGSSSFDPGKFTVGTFDASGASFFSGGTVTGPITAEAVGARPVPEPPTALLLFTGIAGLFGWNLPLRRRAKRAT